MCAEWVFSVPPRNIFMWECRMISDELTAPSDVAGCWVIFELSFVKLTSYLDDSFWVYTCNQFIEWMIQWDLRIFNILSSGWNWTRCVSLIQKNFILLIRSAVGLVSIEFCRLPWNDHQLVFTSQQCWVICWVMRIDWRDPTNFPKVMWLQWVWPLPLSGRCSSFYESTWDGDDD